MRLPVLWLLADAVLAPWASGSFETLASEGFELPGLSPRGHQACSLKHSRECPKNYLNIINILNGTATPARTGDL